MTRFFAYIFFLYGYIFSSGFFLKAQDIAIGKWRDHFSYRNAIALAEGNGKVYCVTKSGLFSYSVKDNSLERLSKITGLSDVEANTVGFNNYNNVLLIAYKNANIDLVEDGLITNLSDIKRKYIPGNKTINSIYFINEFAYLSCGFGIVVIDTKKKEVKETYYIGPNGSSINVRDITSNGNNLFAATDDGVYTASFNSNLSDFNSWTKFSGLPQGIYNSITFFNGNVYANYSKKLTSAALLQDTIFVYDNNTWNFLPQSVGFSISMIKSSSNKLVLVKNSDVTVLDTTLSVIYTTGFPDFSYAPPQQAILDQDNTLWVASLGLGLVRKSSTSNSYEFYFPNGPRSENNFGLDMEKGILSVASGGVAAGIGNLYRREGIYQYTEGTWKASPYGSQADSLVDIFCTKIDPNNSSRIYASSWGVGLVEYNNLNIAQVYNENNSSLLPVPTYHHIRIGGIDIDKDKNVWLSNSEVMQCLSVKKSNNTWKRFDFSAFFQSAPQVAKVLVTKENQVWALLDGKGFLVYRHDGSFTDPDNTNTRIISNSKGSGGLPSPTVFCMSEDNDGEIWVGTDKGIAVFYAPENIFNSSNWDAKQILIEQDGHVQILLETEAVTDIVVDGANRKWIGTRNSGVFLMSADGSKQIFHFDISNSPLPSNNVNSIAINGETGEVFFGTDKGIISYKNTATKGLDNFDNILVYPNPVQPDYTGVIAIKGLMANSDVKITDISGNIIYQTKSLGGQAIWDGKDFSGQRAQTGVYLVFCSDKEGKEKAITKILFIN